MEEIQIPESEHRHSASANFWIVGLALVLLAASAFTFVYGYRQSQTVSQLLGENQQLSATISETRSQLDALNQKLISMTPPPAPPAAQSAAGSAQSGKRAAATDRRLKQMQSQLAAQEEELKRTQNDVAETRTDLFGNLNSTRNELNGSIARTHEELVALERRGERSYFEFNLSKSKQYQRTGPLSISLRKTDPKHNNFDLFLLVDDNRLAKKHVNLYEPVWIHRAEDPQPVQIVVMKITKDHVHGYVSVPKFTRSELASNATAQSPMFSAYPDNSTSSTPSPAPAAARDSSTNSTPLANPSADSQDTQQMPK
jgi:hypothetical protein